MADETNVTDETIIEYADKVIASGRDLKLAQEEQKAAAGRHRNIYKEAKKAGVNTDILKETVALRQVDSAKREMDDRDRERYRKLMGMPIGTQLAMELGATAEPPAAAAGDDEHAFNMAYDDGLKCGRAGADRHGTNPFVPGSALFQEHDRGYMDGQKSIAEGMAPKAAAAPAPDAV